MHRQRLVTGLAGAFGLMTAILVVGGIAVNPALFILAIAFAPITYVLYEHATGRLLSRVYRGVERQAATDGADPGRGGFGAGPREEWTPPGAEQRRRARERVRQERTRRGQQRQRRRAGAGGRPRDGPTAREAYTVLGLDPSADESEVKSAYRQRIKEVHPDTDGGDEEEFKRVREAYEVLTD